MTVPYCYQNVNICGEVIFIKDIIVSHFPHRWINKNKKGVKRLIEGLSQCLLYGEEYTALLLRNADTRTAIELIPLLEEEYGIRSSGDIDVRRAMIIAKKRTLDCPVTKPDLMNMLLSFDITVVMEHYYNEYSIKVVILENPMQIPMISIYDLLIENIRAHIDVWLESQTDIGFTLYTASNVASHATYCLTTQIAAAEVNCIIDTFNILEMSCGYNLTTVTI